MKKIIIFTSLTLILTSCEKLEELVLLNKQRPLVIFETNMLFNVIPKNNPYYVSATGVWKHISKQTIDQLNICNRVYNFPHSVQIKCYKDTKDCTIHETLLKDNDMKINYYIISYEVNYYIKSWDNNKIIATLDDPRREYSFKYCFNDILEIDLNTKEVFIKSTTNPHEECKRYKDIDMPIIHKLIDEDQLPYTYLISLTKKLKSK